MSDSGPSQPVPSSEERPVESDIFYFGGPLFGIQNSALSYNSEVFTNEDNTRVAFCVDPRSPATRRSAIAAGRQSRVLFTAADIERILGDTRNISGPFEGGSDTAEELNDDVVELSPVSISSKFFLHVFPPRFSST